MSPSPPQDQREVDDFATLVVRDYLWKRSLHKTLEVFDEELEANKKNHNEKKSTNIAIGAWYRFSRAIDVAKLRHVVFGAKLKSYQEEKESDIDIDGADLDADDESLENEVSESADIESKTALLPLLIQYLCVTRDVRPSMNAAERTKEARPTTSTKFADEEDKTKDDVSSPMMAGRISQNSSPDRAMMAGLRESIINGTENYEGSITGHFSGDEDEDGDKLALLDEALALDDLQRRNSLYATAIETPLNAQRFHSSTGDLTRAPAMERSGAPSPEKTIKQEATRSTSVEELARRLEKMAEAERRAARLRENQRRRRRSMRKLLQPLENGPSTRKLPRTQEPEDSQATVQPSTSVALTASKTSSALARAQQMDRRWLAQQHALHRHREHPATYPVTFRILDRDLKVGVANAKHHVLIAKDLQRSRDRISKDEMLLLQEKYSCKRERQCALCQKAFNVLNLPMTISYKAIMDLRDSWGVHVRPDVKRSRAPRCYDEVSVCLFCSQFFADGTTYRAPRKVEADADAQLLAFHKSIEHLDPRHEAAFFRP
ncbi:Hypothetical Protein FCC1311_081132 [Hondaea fermentalgiana]|uniref:MINDY4 N-terminal dimerisation domain-containing protein n=1 Tax=Hondaea fermentalgiana TaxID=2315210 RepID=A0A2R5GQ34_9STRA|nr:Hypothetical Protein FCC1311_081132 [Hondaea fermentalgiana]|eukprot:GBG31888.1 Hypothetical Protein FCC1311_081132 [Hondaea fermentalgiana]